MAADPFILLQMAFALYHGPFSFSLPCLKRRGAEVDTFFVKGYWMHTFVYRYVCVNTTESVEKKSTAFQNYSG